MARNGRQPEPDIEPRLVSIDDAARRLGVGRTTVFALLRDGELPSVQIGRRRLLSLAAIDEYVTKLTAAAS